MKRRSFMASLVALVLVPLVPLRFRHRVETPEYFCIMLRDPDETVDPKAPYGIPFWIHGPTPLLRVPWKEWEAVKHLPRPLPIEVRRRLWRVGVQVSELKFEQC